MLAAAPLVHCRLAAALSRKSVADLQAGLAGAAALFPAAHPNPDPASGAHEASTSTHYGSMAGADSSTGSSSSGSADVMDGLDYPGRTFLVSLINSTLQ